jgi:hypothetical protein
MDPRAIKTRAHDQLRDKKANESWVRATLQAAQG